MVSLMDVYGAFLAKVNEDQWSRGYSKEDLEWFVKDWRAFLDASIPKFKFPRCNLKIDEQNQVFVDESMSLDEIEVLATFMKLAWVRRTVDTWENIKADYDESDFSQAKLLETFIKLKDQVTAEAKEQESTYYRSVNKKPFSFRKMCGGGKRGWKISR